MSPLRRVLAVPALAALVGAAACAASPPPVVTAPVIRYEQKLAWILQLEDQRLLRLEPPPAPPVEAPVATGRRARQAAPLPAIPSRLTSAC